MPFLDFDQQFWPTGSWRQDMPVVNWANQPQWSAMAFVNSRRKTCGLNQNRVGTKIAVRRKPFRLIGIQTLSIAYWHGWPNAVKFTRRVALYGATRKNLHEFPAFMGRHSYKAKCANVIELSMLVHCCFSMKSGPFCRQSRQFTKNVERNKSVLRPVSPAWKCLQRDCWAIPQGRVRKWSQQQVFLTTASSHAKSI